MTASDTGPGRAIKPPRRGEISIRRSMLSNMLMVVALLGVAVLATTVIGANGMARQLSRTLIGQTIDRTEAEVRQFIQPVEHALQLASYWVRAGQVDAGSGEGARNLLLPLLASDPRLFGIIVVDPQMQVLMLAQYEGDWRLRLLDAESGHKVARVRFPFSVPDTPPSSETMNMAVTERPWHRAALRSPIDEIGWTRAYRFFQSQQPGISASMRVIDEQGGEWIVAFDVLLESISEFTRQFQVGHRGIVLITDGSGQIIGLPNLARFEAPSTRELAYLRHPGALGFSLAADASRAFQPDPDQPVATEPVRFRSDGRTWWGQGKWIPLDPASALWAGVLIPESELLGTIQQLRILILTVTFLVTALAIARAIALSRRYSQPITALAEQSLRISQGELEQPADIRSRIKELLRLAEAHERMRLGLTSLLKLEGDLALARQIQQKTFPERFPHTARFDIAADSRPADATGGDTFDVVGSRRSANRVDVDDQAPDTLHLLLADATGHGIGPALTAAQVRAMFRMGIRLGSDPAEMARQMNNQLHADAHGGRFVTAWMARLDLNTATAQCHSAGQAPILVYRAARDHFEQLGADAPPFGILLLDDPAPMSTFALERGDVVAVFSDGLLEARSPDDETFGVARAQALVRAHHKSGATAILEAMRAAVARFSATPAPVDDQTAIVLVHR